MTQRYPDDTIQALTDEWWVPVSGRNLCVGRLLQALILHVDQIPKKLTLESRSEPTEHTRARYYMEPFHASAPRAAPRLPVAAMPQRRGELYVASRAKMRPVVVLGMGGPAVRSADNPGKPPWQTSPTVLVAPYYGVTEGENGRAGWHPDFVARIKKCEYPQYLWDRVPVGSTEESILRLDHLQAIGRHHQSYKLTDYRLSEDALMLVEDWLSWLRSGDLAEDSFLYAFRKELLEL